MDAFSLHLCFQVQGDPVTDGDLWNKIQSIPCCAIDSQTLPVVISIPNGDKMLVATGNDGSHCVMHVYRHGLVTMDIQYDVQTQKEKQTFKKQAYPKNKAIETDIQGVLGDKCLYTRSLPSAIQRGKVCPYFQLGDDRIYESEPLELLEEVNSLWQNIKVYKTKQYGNMLCLDDDIMIAESDEIYTTTLLGVERNDFQDKKVLILGGGDGGLLHELLKMSVKHVLMVEIDVEVIKVCRKYLRGVCEDSLDNLTGENYTVRIDNCVTVLKELLDTKHTFDFVINDLSECLIDTDIGHDIDFKTASRILDYSISVLEFGGKYLSRGDSENNVQSIAAFVQDVTARGLHYEKFTLDIPSYNEKYCLFEVWVPEKNGTC